MNSMTSERLEMRWVPVSDGAGRTRMEATWVPANAAGQAGDHASAPHAA